MSIESYILLLEELKTVLTYRVEECENTTSKDLAITEDVFYEKLYISLPEVESAIVRHLINYKMPVLLLGKQGTGKTSSVGKAIRLLKEIVSFTAIVHRCTIADALRFTDARSIDTFLRDQLDFGASSQGVNIYDLLEIAIEKRPSFLRDSRDASSKKLYTSLRRYFDDNEINSQSGLDFDDFISYALKHNRKEIKPIVRAFEESCSLSTLVDLACLQKGADHKILFVIDNIDSLLDSDSIHNAISLLVRADTLVGGSGRVLVASRPRSFYSNTRQVVPLPDAGHNLYETIHIADYLRKVVLPSDDSTQYDDDNVLEFSNAQEANNFYWSMLLRRLEFVMDTASDRPQGSDRDLKSVVGSVRSMFDGNSFCADLITGISNHSFRSFLIAVITFIDKLLREYRLLNKDSYARDLHPAFHHQILGASALLFADCNTSALLYSQLCHFVGHQGGSLPGVDMYRLKIGKAIDHYKKNGNPVNADLVCFYVMKYLNGCQVARYLEDGTIPNHSPSASAMQIAASLKPFGFTHDEVFTAINELIMPDRWDLPVLEFADQGSVVRGDPITPHAQVQLEARGWMIANIFPFRFHYWLGDLQGHFSEVTNGSESIQSLRRVARAIEYMVYFADMELSVVRRAPSEWSVTKKLEEYGKITHIHNFFCYRKVFDLAISYWRRYLADREARTAGDPYMRQIESLVQLLPRMRVVIDSSVVSRATDMNTKESLLSLPEFSFFREWKRGSEI